MILLIEVFGAEEESTDVGNKKKGMLIVTFLHLLVSFYQVILGASVIDIII